MIKQESARLKGLGHADTKIQQSSWGIPNKWLFLLRALFRALLCLSQAKWQVNRDICPQVRVTAVGSSIQLCLLSYGKESQQLAENTGGEKSFLKLWTRAQWKSARSKRKTRLALLWREKQEPWSWRPTSWHRACAVRQMKPHGTPTSQCLSEDKLDLRTHYTSFTEIHVRFLKCVCVCLQKAPSLKIAYSSWDYRVWRDTL